MIIDMYFTDSISGILEYFVYVYWSIAGLPGDRAIICGAALSA